MDAGADALLDFVADLPPLKRQPNLLLGVLQLMHGGPPADGAQLRASQP